MHPVALSVPQYWCNGYTYGYTSERRKAFAYNVLVFCAACPVVRPPPIHLCGHPCFHVATGQVKGVTVPLVNFSFMSLVAE